MKKALRIKKLIAILAVAAVILLMVSSYQTITLYDISDDDIAMSGEIGVTPQMFGAAGDGVTNDTRAFQAAIDYASRSDSYNVVFIPEGTYLLRNVRLKENVMLFGQGEKSILKAHPSCKTWDGILICKNMSEVSLNTLTFDGNKPELPGDHTKGTANVWVDSCSNVSITNCTFQNNWYIGVILQSSNNITIDGNRFLNLDCGVLTSNFPSSNLTIINNYFDGAEYSEPIAIYGQRAGYHENVVITDNIIKNHTKGSGIGLRAVKGAIVMNNTIENCCTGIYCGEAVYNNVVYGVEDTVIENNVILNTVCEGILLKHFNNSRITGNTIQDAGTFGLFTNKARGSIIRQNKFINSDIAALPFDGFVMTLKGLSDSSVADNIIEITDTNANAVRRPIVVGSRESASTNNTFTNNTVSDILPQPYRVVSTNNTIQ